MNEQPALPDTRQNDEAAVARPVLPRLRFPFICLLLFWVASFVASKWDKLYFIGFMYGLASTALVTLLFFGWWWFNKAVRRREKFLGFALIIGEAWIVSRFSHRTIGLFSLWMVGIPMVASVIVAWLFLAKRFNLSAVRLGFVVLVTLTWSAFLLIRADPADSRLNVKNHWRWTPTAEQQFLANAPQTAAAPKTAPPVTAAATPIATASSLSPGDWPEFRGTNRDGIIRGTTIATNWSANPPSSVWKHATGPAWSSVIVVGKHLFTQEQRGDKETVVCYDAATGEQVWVHEDATRFDETVSGPGPRSTPTWSKDRLYTLGGTGLLNCLDAETGKGIWQRDIKQTSGAKVPGWAFSSSPLITDDLVIVYAGGGDKGLLAYRLVSGELAWAAAAGDSSYSSPQLTSIQGVPQCLMLHDGGLTSFDPASGTKLWETGTAMKGAPRCGQPRLVKDNKLLVAALGGLGCSMIEVSNNGGKWTATTVWESKDLKPEFPDFVIQNGYAYGFDVGIFCCINLENGKRTWKDGRYGRGQVMLLSNSGNLLVVSESGELVLLAADPAEHRELGRFQALEGKTWNHPVVKGDRIYLRNADEIACYAAPGKP